MLLLLVLYCDKQILPNLRVLEAGGCLESVWRLSGGCLEGVWMGPKKTLGGQFFLFQHIQTKPSQTKLALSLAQLSPSLFFKIQQQRYYCQCYIGSDNSDCSSLTITSPQLSKNWSITRSSGQANNKTEQTMSFWEISQNWSATDIHLYVSCVLIHCIFVNITKLTLPKVPYFENFNKTIENLNNYISKCTCIS